ncbi:hypothetical protein I552_3201 [Mycobacterium xenopi 3993]|nr:hypothetical protein I552_3201 [Mycobacterium xenopi 3993]
MDAGRALATALGVDPATVTLATAPPVPGSWPLSAPRRSSSVSAR